jgi:DNA-binding MarR family transcriptional regulator
MAHGLTPEQLDVLSAFAQEEPHRMQNLINIIKDGGQDLTALKNKILAIHLDRRKRGISRTR